MKRKLVQSIARAVKRTKTFQHYRRKYGKALGTAARLALAHRFGRSSTQTEKKKGRKNSMSQWGYHKKFRDRKVKVYNRYPKGVSKKMFTKVNKIINHSKLFGEYKYTGTFRLAMTAVDLINPQGYDEFLQHIRLGTLAEIIDAASVLFAGKTIAANQDLSAGNIATQAPLYVEKTQIDFFFKSTSSHVVNIEVWECTPKTYSGLNAIDLANESLNDGDYFARYNNAGVGFVPGDTAVLGMTPDQLGRLNENFWVKRHFIKLKPGDYGTLSVKGCRSKVYDGSKMVDVNTADSISGFHKGYNMKSFVFRTLNDITVSAVTGDCHNWPSNLQGGVAVSYQKTYRIRYPNNLNPDGKKNAFKYGVFRKIVSTSVDQQVAEENPISTTTFQG